MNSFDLFILKLNNYSIFSIKKIVNKMKDSSKSGYITKLIDEVIPFRYITNELVEYVINECGYNISMKSPRIIRNNPIYIKKYIDKFNTGNYINYMDEECLNDELINYAFKYFYRISKESPKRVKYNKKYLEYLLFTYCCVDNIIAFLKFYPSEDIKEEHIKQIVQKNNVYFFDKTKITFYNKRIVLYFIKYVNYASDLDYIFKRCDPSILTTDLLLLAADRGYCPSYNVPDVIRENRELLLYLLKEKNMDCAIVSYFKDIDINEELIDLFVEKDYLISSDNTPNFLKSNYNFIRRLLEHATDSRNVDHIITYCDQDILDDYLIDLAFKKGYSGTDIYSKKIMSNYDYIYRFMSTTGNWNIINKIDERLIDDKLKALALKNRYRFSKYSPNVLRNDYEFVKKTIENDVPVSYYGYCNHTICFCNKDILDDNLITLAIKHGYYFSYCHDNLGDDIVDNPKYVNMVLDKYCDKKGDKSFFIDEILRGVKLKLLSKKQIKKVISKYPSFIINYFCLNENTSYVSNLFNGDYYFSNNPYKKLINDTFSYPISYMLINNSILRKDIVEELGIDNVIRIIKYGLLGSSYFPLEPLLEMNELNNLLLLYTKLTDNSINDIDILKFVNCTIFFYDYYDLVKEVIDSNKIDMYIEQLKLLSENKYNFKDIDTLDKLNNLEENIFNHNEAIALSDDRKKIKNAIYLILVNNTYEEISQLFEIVNVSKIDKLLSVPSLTKYNNLLEYYKTLIGLISEIHKMTYSEDLKDMLRVLNSDLLHNRNHYRVTSESFKDITKVFKRIYAKEAQSKLTKISDRESTDTFIIYNNKYKTRKRSINGEEITKKEVSYIEISEEAYFFQHVMNAFGTGGKLYDFKRRRAIGKSYICLSATSNKKLAKLNKRVGNIDHVVLLFNNIEADSLVYMSPHDIHSRANLNDLSITAGTSDFDTIDNIIDETNSFSEYVVYREDKKGNIIYPCGVLVSGIKPKRAEINAAAYLGIPLIKLLPIKRNTMPLVIENEERIITNDTKEILDDIVTKVKRK